MKSDNWETEHEKIRACAAVILVSARVVGVEMTPEGAMEESARAIRDLSAVEVPGVQ